MWYTGIKCGYDLLYVKICDNNKLQQNVLPLLTAMERKKWKLDNITKNIKYDHKFPLPGCYYYQATKVLLEFIIFKQSLITIIHQ